MFCSGWLIFAAMGSSEDPFQYIPPDQRLDSKSGLLSEFCVNQNVKRCSQPLVVFSVLARLALHS